MLLRVCSKWSFFLEITFMNHKCLPRRSTSTESRIHKTRHTLTEETRPGCKRLPNSPKLALQDGFDTVPWSEIGLTLSFVRQIRCFSRPFFSLYYAFFSAVVDTFLLFFFTSRSSFFFLPCPALLSQLAYLLAQLCFALLGQSVCLGCSRCTCCQLSLICLEIDAAAAAAVVTHSRGEDDKEYHPVLALACLLGKELEMLRSREIWSGQSNELFFLISGWRRKG